MVLHGAGSLAQRQFGDIGFYFVSVVGGPMSSARAVAAAATLASQRALSPTVAGTGAVLASFTSIAFSLSLVLRTRHLPLIRRLATAMVFVAVAGLVGVLTGDRMYPLLAQWLPEPVRLSP